MKRLSHQKRGPFTLLIIGILAITLVMVFDAMSERDTKQFAQAFYSPIRTPTPYPTPTPQRSPTPRPAMLTIEEEIELRKSIGFRSDIAYVKTVRASDDVVINREFGGMAFTPNEANEFLIRLDLEKDGNTLQKFFERNPQFQNLFGGIYLDHAAGSEDETIGGKLVLQIVRDHPLAKDISALVPPLQHPERLHIEFVDFSDKQLKQQFQTISNAASQYSDIQAVFIDQRHNRVTVVITPSETRETSDRVVNKDSLPHELAILLSSPLVVVSEGIVQKTSEAIRGGDSWSNTGGGSNCTLGFKVNFNGWYSMLTAGHCVEELGMTSGDDVYHVATKIGRWSGIAMNGSSTGTGTGIDAAILYMNDFGTASDDVNHYDYYRDIVGSTSAYVAGYWRCWTGMISGTRCGVINCTDLTYFSGNRWYIDMFTVDPRGKHGDSGSPAYRPEVNQKASVTGIKSGSVNISSCTSDFDSDFSKWYNIRDYWDLTLAIDSELYLPDVLR